MVLFLDFNLDLNVIFLYDSYSNVTVNLNIFLEMLYNLVSLCVLFLLTCTSLQDLRLIRALGYLYKQAK